jgi:small subunit ribosomal protein S5
MNTRAKNNQEEQSDLIDRLVAVNRTAKVVKGGRRFGFSALVVVGDGKGRVGFGKGKAKEVIDAKRKATEAARKSMIKVPLREGRTLHHNIKSKEGAGYVIIRSAPPGTGVIAGGPMRAVFEALGVKDVVAKSTGSSNPYNMVASTFRALTEVQSPKATAARRGKKVNEIISQREFETKTVAKKQVATKVEVVKTEEKKS